MTTEHSQLTNFAHSQTTTLHRTVVVRFTMPGFHCYPDAPATVSFLRERHRHLFHFHLHFRVMHANREREYFMQADEVKAFLRATFQEPCEFGSRSCEKIAEELVFRFWTEGCFKVEVSEDGENGSVVELLEAS